MPRLSPAGAAAATGGVLLVLYLATLAPGVTFWDAGELAAAAHGLGVPHPPGTPLWILVAHTWARGFGAVGLEPALALNLLSAACTAAAGAVTAWMAARWMRDGWSGLAAGIALGVMASAWLDATETEVYAAALLLGVLAIACAERRGAGGDARWVAAAAYCLALAAPLHLSALVVAPGVMALAARDDATGAWRLDDVLLLAGATALALGAGTAALAPCLAGLALAGAAVATGRGARGRASGRSAALVILCVAVAASALLFMLVRARHDPVVNQGNPATLAALRDVVARRQYDVAPLWPRQAPAWLQLANVLQYADLQVGLGLSGKSTFALPRTLAAFAWMLLAIAGAGAHRRAHRRSWLAVLVLLVAGSVGVALQLNLKAGPTIGYGILPDDAPHEARERDYFFSVAWWAWGVWAGIGAVAVARARRLPVGLGVALAALPIALNWRGVTRRAEPEASLPDRIGRAYLAGAPPDAVLLARGDNDSYPLWYLQVARGVRRDVVVVTVPLLGARWYREELARRHRLLDESAVVEWRGPAATLQSIARRAGAEGRPMAATAALPAAERRLVGDSWRLTGIVWRQAPDSTGESLDLEAARALLPLAAGVALPDAGPAGGIAPRREPVARAARRLLNCPVAAVRGAPAAQLDSLCNVR